MKHVIPILSWMWTWFYNGTVPYSNLNHTTFSDKKEISHLHNPPPQTKNNPHIVCTTN